MAMTPQQIKNVATGFVHVLLSHSNVYGDWATVAKTGDYAKIGQFLQNEMHLASVPTPDEIKAMDQHLADEMTEDVAAFKDAHPDAPAVSICGQQHGG